MANTVRQMRKRCLRANKECTDSLLEKLLWIDRVDWRCAMGKASSSLWTWRRHGHDEYHINVVIPPWKPWNHDSAADDTQSGSCEKSSCVGSVLTYGDSDWAGDADRFSKSGAATWLRGELGWYPIKASGRKQ